MPSDPGAGARILGRLAAGSVQWRWPVILLWLLVAGASVWLAVARLGINTDTTDMLSPELEFRKQFSAYRAAFPQGKGTLVVVVKGPTSDLTDRAARRLASAMAAEKQRFQAVFFPQGSAFFRRNGLLYLNSKQLDSLSERLTEAQPILGLFVKQPNLTGLSDALSTVLGNISGSRIPAARLVPLLDAISSAVEAASKGARRPVDWSKLLGGFGADRTAIIVTRPALNFGSLSPAKPAMTWIRAKAAELGYSQEDGYSVRLTGSAAISSEEIASVSLGASQAGILSLVLVIVLLFAGLRQPWPILAIVIALLAGLAWTMGFVTLAIGELNLISVAFAVLFIGLGVDFGIHFALRAAEFAGAGQTRVALFRRAGQDVGPALILAAASAALAFLAFLFTDYRGVAELGLIAAVGMAVAVFSCLTLLPALQSLRPVKAAGYGGASAVQRGPTPKDRLILMAALVAGVAAAVASPFLQFDRNPLNLKDPSAESVRTAVSLVNHPRYGLTPLQILARSAASAKTLAARVQKLPEVRSVRTVFSFVPAAQEEKLETIGDLQLLLAPMFALNPAFAAPGKPFALTSVAPNKGAVLSALKALQQAARKAGRGAQGKALREASARLASAVTAFRNGKPSAAAVATLNADLTHGLILRLRALAMGLQASEVGIADLPAGLRARYRSTSGVYKVEVLPRDNLQDNRALKRFVAAVQAVAPAATGTPVVELRAGNAVVDAFLLATALAAAFILVLLLVVLRRVSDVLLVLAPVGLAGLLTIGTAVLFDRSFNFANIIALPLLIGLGAAGGIHVVSRWRAGGAALSRSTTPRAILFSAVTTVASFGTLAVSPHRGTASMGELLMIAIAWSLICSLIILPAALRMLARWRRANG